MDWSTIVSTIITGLISLAVAFGTWHVSLKKDREKQFDEIKEILDNHREEYLDKIRNVQEDITGVNATVQQQIAIIELKIDVLSERVDKHNGVIDRTAALEATAKVHEKAISNLEKEIDKTA